MLCSPMRYGHALDVEGARNDGPDLRRDILCVAQQCFENLSAVIHQRIQEGLRPSPANREEAEEMFWLALQLERVRVSQESTLSILD